MAKIITASDEFPRSESPPAERVHFWRARKHAEPLVLPTDPEPTARRRGDGHSGFVSLAAYVNHGRWVVCCPTCRGAQVVDPTDPRFFCDECKNTDHGNAWLRVHFPKPEVIDLMERVMGHRPMEARNWFPGESIGDLAAENEAHGVDVPPLSDTDRAKGSALPPDAHDIRRMLRRYGRTEGEGL